MHTTHAHTHTHKHASHIRAMETNKRLLKRKRFQVRCGFLNQLMDRNQDPVPESWKLVRELALTPGLCSERWYSEHSGTCRRAALPGRSIKVKKLWKVEGVLMRSDLQELNQTTQVTGTPFLQPADSLVWLRFRVKGISALQLNIILPA